MDRELEHNHYSEEVQWLERSLMYWVIESGSRFIKNDREEGLAIVEIGRIYRFKKMIYSILSSAGPYSI